MDEEDGKENLLQKLYTRQLSLSWDVLSNIQSLLFTGARVLLIRLQDQQQLDLEEVELSIDPVPKANTSEVKMAAPYVTARGEPAPAKPAPPQPPKETEMAEKPEAEAVFLENADKVEKLLNIILDTVDMTNIPCIRAAANNELAEIEHDLWEKMYPEQAEAAKKAQEEREKAEAEAQKRIKEEQEKERKKQAELQQKEKANAA